VSRMRSTDSRRRKNANVSVSHANSIRVTGSRTVSARTFAARIRDTALLRHACRFESEKLNNPANYVDPFYSIQYSIVKADISKIVPFL
jgi:hypothetical protein